MLVELLSFKRAQRLHSWKLSQMRTDANPVQENRIFYDDKIGPRRLLKSPEPPL